MLLQSYYKYLGRKYIRSFVLNYKLEFIFKFLLTDIENSTYV